MSVRRLTWLMWALLLASCEDWDPIQQQERDNAFTENTFFDDARAMRPTVPGTVPQEWYRQQAGFIVRQSPDAGWVEQPPVPLTRELLARGRGHFETWCAPCHGLLGNGQSIVARNMQLRAPPALFGPRHAPHPARGFFSAGEGRLERLPTHGGTGAVAEAAGSTTPGWEALPHRPGFYYAVITEGYGMMPSYAAELTPAERWAVVGWLRVLAYSQRAPLSAAPPEVQATLQREEPPGGEP